MVQVYPREPAGEVYAGVAQVKDKGRSRRRKEMALRGAWCRAVVIRAGKRWCTPLVDILVEYGSISDALNGAGGVAAATADQLSAGGIKGGAVWPQRCATSTATNNTAETSTPVRNAVYAIRR